MFNDLCGQYSTWIIKYCSKNDDSILYLIWYTDTDENSTDKLLTYENGKIFVSQSLKKIKSMILSSIDEIDKFENLTPWLDGFEDLEIVENHTYNINLLISEIENDHLNISTIEGIANFINLFEDFVNQDASNTHLEKYVGDGLLREVWEYYYECIFWPRFNDKAKFDKWDRPPLIIDTKDLSLKLKELISIFDSHVQIH